VKREPSCVKWIELTRSECGVNVTRHRLFFKLLCTSLPAESPDRISCVAGGTATHVRIVGPPLKSMRRYFFPILCKWIRPSVPQLTRFGLPWQKLHEVRVVSATRRERRQTGFISRPLTAQKKSDPHPFNFESPTLTSHSLRVRHSLFPTPLHSLRLDQ
jgi:hypothetical protein